jgi:Holliday junction resolvase RusA-like endonuclease
MVELWRKVVTFKFQGYKFPNSNNAKTYNPRTGKFVLRWNVDTFKKQIALEAHNQYSRQGKLFAGFNPKESYLEVEMYYYTPRLFTAKGAINKKKGDWDGNLKWVQDACCAAMNIDDAFILDASVKQLKSVNEDESFVCVFKVRSLTDR